jgi:hypothetical protein
MALSHPMTKNIPDVSDCVTPSEAMVSNIELDKTLNCQVKRRFLIWIDPTIFMFCLLLSKIDCL